MRGQQRSDSACGGLEIFAADRDPAPLKRLAADGVKTASLDEIAASCRTILLSLPGGKEVEQVCLGEGGLIAKAVLGWTVIDLSTSPISLARRLYAEFEGKASAFADAPVARTRQAAIDGTLSIMVGGTQDCFNRISPSIRIRRESGTCWATACMDSARSPNR